MCGLNSVVERQPQQTVFVGANVRGRRSQISDTRRDQALAGTQSMPLSVTTRADS